LLTLKNNGGDNTIYNTHSRSNHLTIQDIIILGRLGRGATSHVFRAQSSRNKQLYAMKVIDKKASNYDPLALKR